jgi:outer membrane receptor for ferrienterochelin and colicin
MKILPLPSLKYLEECFELDPTSPSWLRWKPRPRDHFKSDLGMKMGNSRTRNRQVETKTTTGYYCVMIDYKTYKCHRIVYALHNKTTDFDNKLIDHIDCNRTNNNPDNLRLVDKTMNNINSKINKSNTGYKYIHYNEEEKCFIFQMQLKYKKYYFRSKDLKEAINYRKNFIESNSHKDFYHIIDKPLDRFKLPCDDVNHATDDQSQIVASL